MKILKPHQEGAVKWLSQRFSALLFMEMRLGKNLTIIRHLTSFMHPQHKILIISEYGAMRSWQDELFSEKQDVSVLEGPRKKRLKELEKGKQWVVSNYESVERLGLHREKWFSVILDETIKIANPNSKITKFLLKNFRDVNLRFALNGKPAPENIMQYCTQFLFVHGAFMGCNTFWQYRQRYYVSDMQGWNWSPKLNHKKNLYDYVHKNAFVLTRKDANIGPAKVYDKWYCELPPNILKSIKQVVTHYSYNDVHYKNDLGVILAQRYLSSGIAPDTKELLDNFKLKGLINLIKSHVDDEKILIWCAFKDEQKAIVEILKKEFGKKYIEINGDVPKGQRDLLKKEFEENPILKFAVLTIPSCAKGQDWSCANTSIYFSNDQSNDLRGQSEDRLVHIEKTNPVLIIDLIADKSWDEVIIESLKEKNFDSEFMMSAFLKNLGMKSAS